MSDEAWSFNQPVLLNKTQRNSSVLVWTLVGTTLFAAGWAVLAPLPETVAVQGKLQPSTPIQKIETPLPGVVEAVLVREGERVRQGQELVRFDSRDVQARLTAAIQKKNALQNQVIINQVLLGESSLEQLSGNQEALLLSSQANDSANRNRDAEALMHAQVRLDGYRQSLQTAEVIADRYGRLFKAGAASELQLLSAQERVDQLRNNMLTVEREVSQLQATANANLAKRDATLRADIETHLRRIADLDQTITKARLDLSRIHVKAPINGTVFDLRVSEGSLVERNEARPLLQLIPHGDLEAKVYLPNSAIGFIQPQQQADISLTSFRASDYNVLPATVKRIGSDALTPEEQRNVLGTDAQGLHFPAVLQLSRQTLSVGERSIPLQSGMSLTADIHLRNRRFLSAITDLFENKRRSLERLR